MTLDGKVAFITGAARGQGRSHAVTLAEAGADIIGVDLCAQIDTVGYPMSTPDDLEETVRLVQKAGATMVARQADVRDIEQLRSALADGLAELGHVDIVLANAGIMCHSLPPHQSVPEFRNSVDVMLTGVWNTLQVAVPPMIEQGSGGSIVITSSAAGTKAWPTDLSGGFDGYIAAKFGVIGLMKAYAAGLAVHSIRVNTLHPTGVATPMIMNDLFPAYAASNAQLANASSNALPVEVIEPQDVSNAVRFLVEDTGRYITGVTLPVDAGLTM